MVCIAVVGKTSALGDVVAPCTSWGHILQCHCCITWNAAFFHFVDSLHFLRLGLNFFAVVLLILISLRCFISRISVCSGIYFIVTCYERLCYRLVPCSLLPA